MSCWSRSCKSTSPPPVCSWGGGDGGGGEAEEEDEEERVEGAAALLLSLSACSCKSSAGKGTLRLRFLMVLAVEAAAADASSLLSEAAFSKATKENERVPATASDARDDSGPVRVRVESCELLYALFGRACG